MLLLFVFLALFLGCFGECPNDGVSFQSVCYHFQPNETAFVNAELECVKLNGHLASIHNGFVNAFIAQQASLLLHSSTTADIWIGATDLINPGTFSWTDGSDFIFTEWQTNKTISGEDCGSLDLSEGHWLMQDCYKAKAYVCAVNEIIVSNVSTTTTIFSPTTTTFPSYYDCGDDWVYLAPTRSCYGKSTKKSFNDAEMYCQNLNAHLISFHTDEEIELVSTLQKLMDEDLWIGLYTDGNPSDADSWKYTDGTDVGFTMWSYSDGNYPKKDNACAYMKKDSWYNDRWCSNEIGVICKKKIS
jgi:hypothetical protein